MPLDFNLNQKNKILLEKNEAYLIFCHSLLDIDKPYFSRADPS